MRQTSDTPTDTLMSPLIRLTRLIPAPPAEIFDAWADPTRKRQWWGQTAGREMVACKMDAWVGGRFRYRTRTTGRLGQTVSNVAGGEILEIDPPHRIVFTWSYEEGYMEVQRSRVTLELTDRKDGTTRAVVTHEGLPTERAMTLHQSHWSDVLDDLAAHCAALV